MSALRHLLAPALACLAAAACSSTPAPSAGADAGYCESNGYGTPSGGACPKGTCLATGTSSPCCGSECASCEAKGLVSYTAAAQCRKGLCPSADVTASLHCCDTCDPIGAMPPEAGVAEGGPDSAVADSGVPEAASD